MIKIDANPIICRYINRRTCTTIIITNYERVTVDVLLNINKLAFFIDTISHYPSMICVVPTDLPDFQEIIDGLDSVASFTRIENY